ncbi:MAG: type II toxin-antitoxin system PemK/MazF family toxin [Verrucomicrobiota bacterium]
MFGEVHLFRMPATDGVARKLRPVLVPFDLEEDAVVCRITSVLRTGTLDVLLTEWLEEGLLKASAAGLDRVVTVEKSLLVKKMGQLTPVDLDAVRLRWNTLVML